LALRSAYREVVGVFVRFRAPLQRTILEETISDNDLAIRSDLAGLNKLYQHFVVRPKIQLFELVKKTDSKIYIVTNDAVVTC
jgi:hypothetical protein